MTTVKSGEAAKPPHRWLDRLGRWDAHGPTTIVNC
jgi:hypothetical protein